MIDFYNLLPFKIIFMIVFFLIFLTSLVISHKKNKIGPKLSHPFPAKEIQSSRIFQEFSNFSRKISAEYLKSPYAVDFSDWWIIYLFFSKGKEGLTKYRRFKTLFVNSGGHF